MDLRQCRCAELHLCMGLSIVMRSHQIMFEQRRRDSDNSNNNNNNNQINNKH